MDILVSDLRSQYVNALRLWPFLPGYEQFARLPRMMLFAVGSRETNLDPHYTQGWRGDPPPNGHGRGLFQLDDRFHTIPPGFDTDPHIQAQTAAEMLVANFKAAGSWLGALAMYNSGQTNDQYTTGHDYGADVLARRETLDGLFPSPGTDRLIAPAVPPMSGNDVKFYQLAMNLKHFPGTPIATDGIYGPQSQAAVRLFQKAHGLVADGIIGPATRAAMAKVPMPQ